MLEPQSQPMSSSAISNIITRRHGDRRIKVIARSPARRRHDSFSCWPSMHEAARGATSAKHSRCRPPHTRKQRAHLPRAPARSAVLPRRDCPRGARCRSHSVRSTPRPLPNTVPRLRTCVPAAPRRGRSGGPDSLLFAAARSAAASLLSLLFHGTAHADATTCSLSTG